MDQYLIQEETLVDIANAIRSKTGSNDSIAVTDMAEQIESISSGGGESTDTSILYVRLIGDFDLLANDGWWVEAYEPTWDVVREAYLDGRTVRVKFETSDYKTLMLDNVCDDADVIHFSGVDPIENKMYYAKIYPSGDAELKWEQIKTLDTIRYVEQKLTEEQQMQARANIGALGGRATIEDGVFVAFAATIQDNILTVE